MIQARENTAVIAHQYLHNQNHGQIYIQSSQGAAANNTISFSGWNIKYAEKSLSLLFSSFALLFRSVLS